MYIMTNTNYNINFCKMGKQELSIHLSDNSSNNFSTSNFNNKHLSKNNLNFKQSHRSKLTLYKNLNTSKTSIENELIYSKKITDIPSRYKTEKITFENSFYMQLEPDIVCYNMETHYDGPSQPSKDAVNKKINKPKAKTSNPQQSDHSPKKNTDKDKEDDIDINSIKRTRISKTRLLHSRLRPDTSNTSVIELPDIKYTLSTEKLPKLKYPKNVPPPVFKQVGSYKCKIPTMTSKERLLERQRLIKEHKELQKMKEIELEKESVLSIDRGQQSKFLKRKENTQYDIIFGKEELEEHMKENIDEEPIEAPHRMKAAAKKLFKRFQKVPKSESEIIIVDDEPEEVEQPRRPSPIKIPIDDSEEEIEIDSEEEPDELQLEEYFEEEPEEQIIEIIPKKESSRKVQKKVSSIRSISSEEVIPNKERSRKLRKKVSPIRKISSEEVIPNKESSRKLQKKESSIRKMSSEKIIPTPKKLSSKEISLRAPESSSSSEEVIPSENVVPEKKRPIKAIEKKESSVKAIHTEVKEKPKSEANLPSSVDECMEQCKYKPLCTARKTASKPGSRKPLVIFKECDRQMCTYDQNPKGQECGNLMRNIAIQYNKNKPKSVEIIVSDARALPSTKSRSSRGSANYNGMEMNGAAAQHSRQGSIQPNAVQQDPRYSIGNGSEVVKPELRNPRNRSKRLKKCEYNSKEELYEKELQNYDYVTNHVSQNHQNVKATDHNLLLDLNFQNKITQTRHSQTKGKSNQTMNYFPSNENRSMSVPWRNDSTSYNYSKNALHVPKGKDFKIIRTTPAGVPQLLIISHPARRQSQVSKPGIDIIYKNSKYSACPAYAKAVIPRENSRRMSANSNNKYIVSPKYIKSSIPRENSQRISVDTRKYSYSNNLQYNLPRNKLSRISAYFVNVPQESQPNVRYSQNLKTVERNLSIKLA